MKLFVPFALRLTTVVLLLASLRAQKPELVVQTGQFLIRRAVFSPDNRLLATASADGSVKLWNVRTGEELRTLTLGDGLLDTLAFNHDSSILAALSPRDGKISLWQVPTGARIGEFASGGPFSLHPVRNRIAYLDKTSAAQARIVVRDLVSGDETQVLAGARASVSRLRFSPDGSMLAAGSESTTIWRLTSGKAEGPIAGTIVAFSPDSKQVLTMSHEVMGLDRHPLLLWQIQTLQQVKSWPSYSGALYGVTWTADDQLRALGCDRLSDSKTVTRIKSWGLTQSSVVTRVEIENCFHEGNGAVLSPDGTLFTMGEVYMEEVLSAADGLPMFTLTGGSSGITSTAFMPPDGKGLITASFQGEIKLWSPSGGRMVANVRAADAHAGARLTTIAINPDGMLLAAGDARGEGLKLFYMGSAQEPRTLLPSPYALWSLVFSPDGRRLAASVVRRQQQATTAHGEPAVENGPAVILLDVATGREVYRFGGFATADFSPDSNKMTLSRFDAAPILWNLATQQEVNSPPGLFGRTVFSPSGKLLATRGKDNTVRIVDSASGKLNALIAPPSRPMTFIFVPKRDDLIATSAAGTGGRDEITLWQAGNSKPLRTFAGHAGPIPSFSFSPDGKYLMTGGMDRMVKLWEVQSGKELASLISSGETNWAVLTPQGRFDASEEGMQRLLHWVVGAETIAPQQIKKRYHEPYLLAKVLGFNDEPLETAEPLLSVRLFPQVETNWLGEKPGGSLGIKLKNRGGGIGQVQVFVNNIEYDTDVRHDQIDPNAGEASLTVNLAQGPLVSGELNTVRVVAWNSDASVASRGEIKSWKEPRAQAEARPQELYAIVAGISQYGSDALKLSFASKDARSMAKALRISGIRLFGCGKVHIWLLTGPAETTNEAGNDPCSEMRSTSATKDNFRQAFEDARRARTTDTFVVYLAGHGVTLQRGTNAYFYLTQEAATTTDISGPRSISSDELARWINRVYALKRALVLDTCGAGGARASLSEVRTVTGDQIKALDTLKDRTGFNVLMGSAADALSYEASEYGEGLLTYALLQGIKGAALSEDRYVEVQKLFGHTEETVPRLARHIGGIQKPEVMIVGRPFYIGMVTSEDKQAIPLASAKPVLLRPSLIDSARAFDDLKLGPLLGEKLRDASDAGVRGLGLVYLPETDYPDGIVVSGVYSIHDNKVKVHLVLLRNGEPLREWDAEGSTGELQTLVEQMADKIIQESVALAPPSP